MLIHHVKGHGRLMEPPARNAMWRFGFPNPVNYNDNGKFLMLPLQIFFLFLKFLINFFFISQFDLALFSELFCGGWSGNIKF